MLQWFKVNFERSNLLQMLMQLDTSGSSTTKKTIQRLQRRITSTSKKMIKKINISTKDSSSSLQVTRFVFKNVVEELKINGKDNQDSKNTHP